MSSRFQKRCSSLLALIVFVFAQLAVSAYACPQLLARAQMEDCADGPMPAASGLCQAHCQDGQQNVGDRVAPENLLHFVAIFSVVSSTLDPRPALAAFAARRLIAPQTAS